MSRALGRLQWACIALLLLFAASQLAHRTPPVKRDAFFFDFSNAYAAARTWLAGENPYDIEQVFRVWDASRHGTYLGTTSVEGMHTWAAVHPPSTLLMIAPFAAFTAVPGHALWVALSLGLTTATFFALFSLAGLEDLKSRMWLLALALASAPMQGALGSGQPALPAISLVILAAWAFSKDRLILAGIILGLATAVKMQVGGPFILYYLFIRQWKVGTLALILFAVATLIAVARMESIGVTTWWADWHRNITATLAPGGINDPRPGGPFRNDMVNLQTLVDVVLHRQWEANLCVLLIFLPLLIGFLTRVRPGAEAGKDLFNLSVVAVLSFLPLYRRLYDTTLLIMLLAWALAALRGNQRVYAIAVLALLGELLLPIDLIPFVLRRTRIFDAHLNSWWWQGIVVTHHAWGIVALSIGLAYIFYLRTRTASVEWAIKQA